ncbi:hypothetical protein G9A89_013650 [Geosiphon pyriformis]|nr:hypothetical protein G9A89_013650 [Geosiphon pyriformis]
MENIAINKRQTLCLITKELNRLNQQNYAENALSIIESTKCYHFLYPLSLPVILVSFGGKTWTQIAGGSSSHVSLLIPSGANSTLSKTLLVVASNFFDNSGLIDCMASLECSMELLLDQVSEILRKLSFVELVPISSSSCIFFSVVASSIDLALNSDMAVDSVIMPSSSFSPSLLIGNVISDLSLSSSKVITTKVDGLESKMMALEVSVSSVLTRLDSLCSGLGLSAPFLSQ